MTHDRNKNRSGYKKTKVGWIPEEWECTTIGAVADINPKCLPENTPNDYCFFYLDLASVNNGYITIPKKPISFSTAPCRARRLIQKGDVLLSTVRPNLQGFAYVEDDYKDLVSSTGFAVLRSVDNYFAPFLYHFLYSFPMSRYFYNCVVGSSYPALNNSDVENAPISRPPLPEQHKIAEILSTWDAAIERTRKLVDAKKRRKKALMQQLLTGKMRLPQFQKKNNHESAAAKARADKTNQKHEKVMPDGWRQVRLGDVFNERRETGFSDLPLLAVTGNRGIIPADEVDRKDSSSADKSRYKRICPGDIGYNTMRMWQGVSALSGLEGIISPAYTVCTPKDDMDARFVAYFFKFHPVIHLFWRYSQGMVSDTLNLKYHNFAEIKVVLPERTEQRAIAEVLETADNEIRLHESELAALEKQKRGLMQKLLTGEVRVRVCEGTSNRKAFL
jgi:type I restriction enzyme S subunit